VLASELVRAAEGRRVGEAQPIRAGGLDGVSQRLEGGSAAPRLQIKTVTLRGALCTYDWVLIAPTAGRYAELEDGFDVWWQSFEPGPTERPVASRAEGRS
jgi:hypothetical protein